MKKILLAALLALAPAAALAQSSPGLVFGQVPTAAQWNSYFAAKQDALGYRPVNQAGDVMTGPLVLFPSTTAKAGLTVAPGVAPTSPVNGDVWTTAVGIFVRINGATVGPLASANSATFAATAPIAVSFPSSVVTYALNIDATLQVGGGNLGLALGNSNTWTAAQNLAVNSNTSVGVQLTNSSALTSALIQHVYSNGTNNMTAGMGGTGLSTALYQGRGYVTANGTGLVIGTSTANPFIQIIGNAEVGRWDSATPGKLVAGVAGVLVGNICLANVTTGSICLAPPAGALGTSVLTAPAVTDTLVARATTDTLTNKTYDTAGAGNSLLINGVAATANTGTGAVARAASPALTGTPTAPTAAFNTNTTQIASTAFVLAQISGSVAGVSSIDAQTGVFTTGNGIDSPGKVIELTAARRTLPTPQVFITGSGTYTTPANALWIEVEVVGGGGGGEGGNNAAAGTAGGASTFGTSLLTAGGGAAGGSFAGGAGGTATGGDANIPGGAGGAAVASSASVIAGVGGSAGGTCLGGGSGGATSTNTAASGPTNTGIGGAGGGSTSAATVGNGGGGGGGGCVRKIIVSPLATYPYAVGAGGPASAGGANGGAGGAGADGHVVIIAHFGS